MEYTPPPLTSFGEVDRYLVVPENDMPISESNEATAATKPPTYSERGYTWPMTIRQRDRILNTTPPDMRAVFYAVELRAREALGQDKMFRQRQPTKRTVRR